MILPVVGLLLLSLSSACPYNCKCSGSTVDCTRLELTTFPNNIPSTTRILRLSHNKLTILPPNSLAQLGALEELYVYNNKLNFLYNDTFRANHQLKVLHLGQNKIQELPYDLLSSQQLLITLSVDDNELASLPDDLFKNTPYLSTLSLEGNPNLRVVPLKVVSLHSITKITVDSVECKCSTLALTHLLTSQQRDNVSCGTPQALVGVDVRSLHSTMFDGCNEGLTNKASCLQDEFQCANSECIDIAWRCDKMLDCTDGSDETNCQGGCDLEEFQCGSGHCVEKGVRCDGNFDCMDKSDEEQCITTVIPDIVECDYECDNKEKCLSSTWLCDGYTDCTDGSDEAGCSDAVSTVCGEGQFECYTNQRCINTTQMCDGANDCGDGSDEGKFLCRGERTENKPPCPAGQVQCANGECLWHNWLCDGMYECQDQSDELNCGLEACNGTMTACDNGRCIDSDWLCDGTNDCGDNSDELNCEVTCSDSEILCGSGECVHCKWACDGYNDCKDGSDEAVCPVKCSGSECLESVSGKVFTVANIVMIVTCSAVILVSAFVIFIIIKCRYKRTSASPRPPRYNEIDFTSQQTINQSSIPRSPPPRYKSEPDLNSGVATRLIEESSADDSTLCTRIEISPASLHTSVVSLSSSSDL